jgi:hypothetical protein
MRRKYASRKKAQAFYGSRSGITSEGLGSIGGTTTYKLFSSSDKDTTFSRDIEDLTDIGSWVIEKELITPETPAGYVKQFDTGSGSSLKAVSRYKSSNIENLANSLLNRLSVSITAVVVSNSVICYMARDYRN